MTFGEHLDELRTRLIHGLLGLIVIFIPLVVFGRDILDFMMEPARKALIAADMSPELLATSPFEPFGAFMRVTIVFTIALGAPWLVYQAWKFVAPGLYPHERRFGYLLMPMSLALTAIGAVFMYTVMLPVVLSFFIRFAAGIGVPETPMASQIQGIDLPSVPVLAGDPSDAAIGSMWINEPLKQLRLRTGSGPEDVLCVGLTRAAGIVHQYRISEYIKLVFGLALAFALGFQMPVVVLLLGWADIVRLQDLRRIRKYAVFGCAVASAVLTPADPISMILLAVPLYLLYEFGLLLLALLPPERVARGLHSEPPSAGDE